MYLTTEIESIDSIITSQEISILDKLKLTKLETNEDSGKIDGEIFEEK